MIIFDLETRSRELPDNLIEYRRKTLNFKDLKTGNLKDPVKIAEKAREVEEYNIQLAKDMTRMDAADIDYAEIIASGIKEDGSSAKVMIGPTATEEKIVERTIGVLAENRGPIVGFNIIGFDIPLIKRAAVRYGIKIPAYIFARDNVLDLMELMKENYKTDIKRQMIYAMIYGFDLDVNLANSAEVPERWANGDIAWIKNHLIQDLEMSDFLFNKFKNAQLIPEKYYGVY